MILFLSIVLFGSPPENHLPRCLTEILPTIITLHKSQNAGWNAFFEDFFEQAYAAFARIGAPFFLGRSQLLNAVAGDAAMMQDAGMMGGAGQGAPGGAQDPQGGDGSPQPGGEISDEDIAQVLMQMVQSGELKQEEAMAIMQALQQAGGDTGGGMPPGGGGMPPGGGGMPPGGGGMPPGGGGMPPGAPGGGGPNPPSPADGGGSDGGKPASEKKKESKDDDSKEASVENLVKKAGVMADAFVDQLFAPKSAEATKK